MFTNKPKKEDENTDIDNKIGTGGKFNDADFGKLFLCAVLLNFLLFYVISMTSYTFNGGAIAKKHISDEMAEIKVDDVVRCISYTSLFEKDGTKKYIVNFRSYEFDSNFECIIDAKEIDEKCNVEKDAKYNATLFFVYSKDIIDSYENKTVEYTEIEKQNQVLSTIKMAKNEYFVKLYDVDFMYSDCLTLSDKKTCESEILERCKQDYIVEISESKEG